MMTERKILYVLVGSDTWKPTTQQMTDIGLNIEGAIQNHEDAVALDPVTKQYINLKEYKDEEISIGVEESNLPRVDLHVLSPDTLYINRGDFNSADDKRVTNNPILPEDYVGEDDVSLRYRSLSDAEKRKMGEIKLQTQLLINNIRGLGSHPDIDEAIRNAQLASMWAIKYITSSIKMVS